MFEYLKENKLLTKFQATYLPESSTETQVLEMYHKVLDVMDSGKDIRFLFLDVRKAFDRIWHVGLLSKLNKYGIYVRLHKWLNDYWPDHSNTVITFRVIITVY